MALCAVGAEKAVSNELRKLGLSVADSGFGRVRFRADRTGLYRSLMGLRAADRVLLEAGFFRAEDFDALFEGVRAVNWENLVPAKMGLKVVKVRTNRSRLRAETSIQGVVHKAAAERLCGARRIELLPEGGEAAEVRVYVEKDMVSLLLDLSGAPLFKRGYRTEGGIAPLRETTAAAMLLLSGWKRKFPLYDPFCGSGTILIEAAMYAWDMAPGLGRSFAIDRLSLANREIAEAVRAELRSRINFERTIRIAGSDADSRAVSIARSNIGRVRDMARGERPQRGIRPAAGITVPLDPADSGRAAGFAGWPVLKIAAMKDARPAFADDAGSAPSGAIVAADGGTAEAVSGGETGFIVTNPPYGRRLGDPAEAERIYGEMNVLRKNFPGWKLAVLTDHPGFESFFGRKADSCREISNGAIPSYFFQYKGK
ncbi:MAG: class I SAM-dependent RNA methyltransferase [Treponema sp.]|nr:class I SAM-dependent RNA methyltransferase [Treponema sp.]